MDNYEVVYRDVLHDQFVRLPWDANTPQGYLIWWCRSHRLEDYTPGEFFDTCNETLLHELLRDVYDHMERPDYIPVDSTDWKVASLMALDPLPSDMKMEIMQRAGLVRKFVTKWEGPSPRMKRLMAQWKRNQLKASIQY